MSKKLLISFIWLLVTNIVFSQATDSVKHTLLGSVTIRDFRQNQYLKPLPSVKETYIFAGKKTEVIHLDQINANTVDNSPRQIFSKIPGIFVYEDDGTGNQISISSRGLDPHRSWEFNVRQNGIMTNTDIYGYPASHFIPPVEAVDRIVADGHIVPGIHRGAV